MDQWVNIQYGWMAIIYVKAHNIRPNNKLEMSKSDRDALNPCLDTVMANRRWEDLDKSAKKHQCGNCEAQTAIVMGFLARAQVTPREQMVLWMNDMANSHSFVVIGRNRASDINDPTKWGDEAVIIDPWHGNGNVYPAREAKDKLFRGPTNRQGQLDLTSIGRTG